MANWLDLCGSKFGRWTVQSRAENGKHNFRRWNCACECGVERAVFESHLKRGTSKSCGCFSKDTSTRMMTRHGESQSKEHRIWCGMRARCSGNVRGHLHYYAERGIKLATRWEVFENFLSDMGRCPSGMSLDRIDNDGDYTPENCRWATASQQQSNKRSNVIVQTPSGPMVAAHAAKAYGIPYKSLKARLGLGWDDLRAVTTPIDLRYSHPRRAS